MKRLDTSNRSIIGTALLVHGDYNTFKTYLLGSILAHEKAEGPCVYAHIAGEPAPTSLYSHDLEGVEMFSLESIEDCHTLAQEQQGARVIAVDSLIMLEDLATQKLTGGKRAPGGVRGEHDGRNEWGKIKFEFKNALMKMRRACQLFVAVCPSAKNVNEVTGEKFVMPDLLGKFAAQVSGWFNFVGYAEAVTLGGKNVRRSLDFAKRTDAATRCNGITPILKPIQLPAGPDVWLPVREALVKALGGKQSE